MNGVKVPWVLLAGSLVLNGLFLLNSAKRSLAVAPQVSVNAPAIKEIVVTNVVRLDWRAIESTNFVTYIERLREIGCPEETVRDLVIAEIDKLHAPRLQEINSSKPAAYWEPMQPQWPYAEKLRQFQVQLLEIEKARIIWELLGVDLKEERFRTLEAGMEDPFKMLNPEKRFEARFIYLSSHAQELEVRLRNRIFGEDLTMEQKLMLKNIRISREEKLRNLLPGREYAQLEMKISSTAETVREGLQMFDNPSETDFLEFFVYQKKVDDAVFHLDSGADMKEKFEIEHALREELKEKLGSEKVSRYEMRKDNVMKSLAEVARLFDLPVIETQQKIWAAKRILNQEERRVYGRKFSEDLERVVALGEVRQKYNQELVAILGEAGAAYYNRLPTGQRK